MTNRELAQLYSRTVVDVHTTFRFDCAPMAAAEPAFAEYDPYEPRYSFTAAYGPYRTWCEEFDALQPDTHPMPPCDAEGPMVNRDAIRIQIRIRRR